jgi:hypothetical protein
MEANRLITKPNRDAFIPKNHYKWVLGHVAKGVNFAVGKIATTDYYA